MKCKEHLTFQRHFAVHKSTTHGGEGGGRIEFVGRSLHFSLGIIL